MWANYMTPFVDATVFKIKKFRKEATTHKNKSDFQFQLRDERSLAFTMTTRRKLDELQINDHS